MHRRRGEAAGGWIPLGSHQIQRVSRCGRSAMMGGRYGVPPLWSSRAVKLDGMIGHSVMSRAIKLEGVTRHSMTKGDKSCLAQTGTCCRLVSVAAGPEATEEGTGIRGRPIFIKGTQLNTNYFGQIFYI